MDLLQWPTLSFSSVKQTQNKEAILQEQIHEAMKPLARYSDDADLDAMRRQEERAEDPMLAFIQKRKRKEEEKAGIKKKKGMPGEDELVYVMLDIEIFILDLLSLSRAKSSNKSETS